MTPVRQTVKFDKKLLDKDAVKVVQTLIKAGYDAYLVGGGGFCCVLGLAPSVCLGDRKVRRCALLCAGHHRFAGL